MDINVSPDLPAYYCYLAVLLLGLATAGTQVSKRLGNVPGKWIMVNTWLLFFVYTLIPVALFWLLDRTSAIHDTSLFAAVLVGAGYQQILSGSFANIKAPGDASVFLKPFDAWAQSISTRILDRVVDSVERFNENLFARIVNDPGKFDALRHVVLVHVADPAKLDRDLKSIASQKDVLGDEGVLKKQASLLYMNLKVASPRLHQFLLYKNKVIPRRLYLWYAKEWRSKVTAIVVAVALVGAGAAGVYRLTQPPWPERYFLWRLHKANGTVADRYQARTRLVRYLADDPSAYSRLAALLTTPNLSVETADSILAMMIETRDRAASQQVDLMGLLAESLRSGDSDVREHVQKTLLYLAKDRNLTVPKELQSWISDSKDTASNVDAMVKKWHAVAQ